MAAEIGMDRVESQLLPGDKVAQVEKLLAEKGPKENLAFVGDGIVCNLCIKGNITD